MRVVVGRMDCVMVASLPGPTPRAYRRSVVNPAPIANRQRRTMSSTAARMDIPLIKSRINDTTCKTIRTNNATKNQPSANGSIRHAPYTPRMDPSMTIMLIIRQKSSPPKQVETPIMATMKIAAASTSTVVRLQLRLALMDGVDNNGLEVSIMAAVAVAAAVD